MPQAQVCNHPNLISTAYLKLIKCTTCGTSWAHSKDGHSGTVWILNEKGGDKRNDANVSSQGAQGRRLS
jgi:hypothetical protein